jgi:hypothetical protein
MKGYVVLTKIGEIKIEAKEGILVGRDCGRASLNHVIASIENSPSFSVIPLDFGNLRFLDFSSADEFLGKLISRLSSGEFKDIYIYLENLSAETEETIDAMLQLRGQNAVVIGSDGFPKILGKLNPVLKETFDLITTDKEVSARKLADKKNIAINASSNRLTKLQSLGLIARMGTSSGKGAEQFVYRSLVT